MDPVIVITVLLFSAFVIFLLARMSKVEKEIEEMKGDAEAKPFVQEEFEKEFKKEKKKRKKSGKNKNDGDQLILS